MSEYRIVSSDELYHFGIKGMKWGIRRYQNEDGSLTDAGRRRYYKNWQKQYTKEDWKAKPEDMTGMSQYSDIKQRVSEQAAELNNVNNEIGDVLMKDYFKRRHEYASVGGLAAALINRGPTVSMEELAQDIWFYANEDGDQGSWNSTAIYAVDKKIPKETLNDLYKKQNDAKNNLHETLKQEASNLFGKYSDKQITGYATAGQSLAVQLLREFDKDRYVSHYFLSDAIEGYKWASDQKSTIRQAKSIIAKLGIADGKKSSWSIVEAVQNAGLSNKPFNQMTDADWLAISKELDKLPDIHRGRWHEIEGI